MIINISFIVEIWPYTVYHLLSTIGIWMSFKLFINVIILNMRVTSQLAEDGYKTEIMTSYHLHQQPPTCQVHQAVQEVRGVREVPKIEMINSN